MNGFNKALEGVNRVTHRHRVGLSERLFEVYLASHNSMECKQNKIVTVVVFLLVLMLQNCDELIFNGY